MSDFVKLSHAEYLAHAAYGSSDIIRMADSFAYWAYSKRHPEPPGRPLVVGSAVHLLLQSELEDRALAANGIDVYRDGSSKTKGFEKFQAENPTKYCLDEDEHKQCIRMVSALMGEAEVMRYLTGAIPEASLIAKYPETDVQCKCRPDYLHKGRGVSINLKTCRDASESGFIYATKEHHYDFQSAFYIDLLTNHFKRSFDEIHILVQKPDADEPVKIKIFSFDEDTLGWARAQIRAILGRIPMCEQTGIWPPAPVALETVNLPLYARTAVPIEL